MIDIVGYITKTNGERGFTIKVTSEKTDFSSFTDIHDSKEVDVYIDGYRYPHDSDDIFTPVSKQDNYRRDLIKKHRSLSDALRPGDRVKCSVYIVEKQKRDGVEAPVINNNRKDIQSYEDFPLWLCPYGNFFERLDIDTPETIKFRKQNYYRNKNWKKCEEITGDEWNGYRDKPWINRHPIRTLPRMWGIQVKTTISNLWNRFTRQENLPKASLIANIILAFTTTISIAVNIILAWLLFSKGA